MREAHAQAAAVIRQYVDHQGDGVADTQADHDKVATALHELADRHDRAALATRPQPSLPRPSDLRAGPVGNNPHAAGPATDLDPWASAPLPRSTEGGDVR